ncbi:nicotinate-nucleotide adenylyltransferase [Nitrosospira sp. Nsp5]|uniref:nicotinate-nucleotide adenylyltransferase n=1 Tax=Nitrosospira multiformis TaxID=1231 RepID=A0ABY0TGT8_9PROT|nr:MULTISPECIES: adenylyltransferase/cytidyltransferase family protein [Nitrosospira]PTR10547.1 nicotinate-nucleotide adenylyltransferase [Nitrosospira sp. Nsp5]SDQ81175.1 nicotinate-nucleotide adenylyltransferase [Nitrosospira multiformis]
MAVTSREARRSRIGVFVGSFNPPHLAHLFLVQDAMQEFGLNLVYVVADRLVKYKALVNLVHRQKMIDLLFGAYPGVLTQFSAKDNERFEKAELWDIHRTIEEAHPDDDVYLILGASTLEWYVAQFPEHSLEVVRQLIVCLRDEDSIVCSTLARCTVQSFVPRIRGASSTQVRDQLTRGVPTPLLTPELIAYIAEHNLYASTTPPKAL